MINQLIYLYHCSNVSHCDFCDQQHCLNLTFSVSIREKASFRKTENTSWATFFKYNDVEQFHNLSSHHQLPFSFASFVVQEEIFYFLICTINSMKNIFMRVWSTDDLFFFRLVEGTLSLTPSIPLAPVA